MPLNALILKQFFRRVEYGSGFRVSCLIGSISFRVSCIELFPIRQRKIMHAFMGLIGFAKGPCILVGSCDPVLVMSRFMTPPYIWVQGHLVPKT